MVLYTVFVRGLLRSLCSNQLPYSDASTPSAKLSLQILGFLRLPLQWWFRFAAIAAPGLRFRLAVRLKDSATPPGNHIPLFRALLSSRYHVLLVSSAFFF